MRRNHNKKNKLKLIFLTALISVIIDQAIKIWIKTNMFLGQYFEIFDWFVIYFTENNGMAFGLEFGGEIGKLILTLTRIFIVVFAIRYLFKMQLDKYKKPVIICFGLILGGAIGNIIDCLMYGVVFDDSYNNVASIFPQEGGYSSIFYGKVVDMFYFPIISTEIPSWVPFFGGNNFTFFKPVFNFADSCISVGAISLILFFRKDLR
tara:strand:- start:2062 stop:2679 length:618 start_codon:yes stop_codon:yes gene_type:complete